MGQCSSAARAPMTLMRCWSPTTAADDLPASRQASKIVDTAGPMSCAGWGRPSATTQLARSRCTVGSTPVANVAWFGYVAEVITARPMDDPPSPARPASVGVTAADTWRGGNASMMRNTTRVTVDKRRVRAMGGDRVGDLSERLVDALQGAYGVHPGHRAAHAKGVLCAATFTATPAAGAITRAAHFQGAPVRAHVRFSNGGGDPTVPDGTRDARGIAVKLYLGERHHHRRHRHHPAELLRAHTGGPDRVQHRPPS